MNIPNDLRLALERELRAIPAAELARTATELSARYRTEPMRGPFVRNDREAAAYAALRMPATFAAVAAALVAAQQRLPGFAPRSLLDVGAGTGAALWAAGVQTPSLTNAMLIEAEPAMSAFGQRLARYARAGELPAATWRHADLRTTALPRADLTTAAYSLGELPPAAREAAVSALWTATTDLLLIVEPGTPAGFAVIRTIRAQLIAAGAQIVAPCPHNNACPMPADDWCHFAQRITRTGAQRSVKGAPLSYEDEKFAYVAAAHVPGTPITGRILRHPQIRKGFISLAVCAPDGLHNVAITRSDAPLWRQARNLDWGDALQPEPTYGLQNDDV